MLEAAEAARAAPLPEQPPRASDLLLDGLAVLISEGYATGAPIVKRALCAFRDDDLFHSGPPQPREHGWKEQPLFRLSEPRCRPGGEHDGRHLSRRATPWGLTP